MIDNNKIQQQITAKLAMIEQESKQSRPESSHAMYMMGVTKGLTTFGEVLQQAAIDEKAYNTD